MSEIIIKNDTMPVTPDSGKTALYIDSVTKKLRSVDDTGSETDYAAAGAGDVVGAASSIDSNVVFFDGVTGKTIKDSGLTLSGSNTGDQTSVTGNSGSTDALKSATTTVNVASSTAPTTGQVLTATSDSAATWQDAGGGGLTPPVSSTDNAIVKWDGVGADTVQDSNVLIDDDGRISQTALGQSTFIGVGVGLLDDGTTNNNTAVGYQSFTTGTTNSSNTCVGYRSGYKYNGNSTTCLGERAGGELTWSGGQTVLVGSQAGRRASGTGCKQSVIIGANAASSATLSGNGNVFIGFNNSVSCSSGGDNIVIGTNKTIPTATTSNHLNIGDMITADMTTDVVDLANISLTNLPTFADEAAAVTGGLAANRVYKTATGELRIKL